MPLRFSAAVSALLLSVQFVLAQDLETIKEALEREIRRHNPQLSRIEVHGLKVSPEPLPVEGRLLVLDLPERPFGRCTFQLLLHSGNRTQRVFLTAEVRAWAPVVKAKRTIGRFETLKPEDLTVEEVEVSRLYGFFSNPEELLGKRSRTFIPKGTVIRPEQLEELPEVRKGQRVTLILERSSLSVTCQGLALEDGRLGERVKVKALPYGKGLYGEVVDEGTVRVMYP